jgi:hypothetical protein
MIWNHERGHYERGGVGNRPIGLSGSVWKRSLKTPPVVKITSLLIEKIFTVPQRHEPVGILSAQVDLIE